MASLLNWISRLFTQDLTGRTWEKELTHPSLGKMIYFGSNRPGESYWEAQVVVEDQSGTADAIMEGTADGPSIGEIEFCSRISASADEIFESLRVALELEHGSIPLQWRQVFRLEYFEVPKDGSSDGQWELIFRTHDLGTGYRVKFENGRLVGISHDE